MMASRQGPMELTTSFSKDVGKMSKGLEEVFMLLTSSDNSRRDKGEKQLRIGCRVGQTGRGEEEGTMLNLTPATLSTKNERKLLQSLSENTGTAGDEGLTILFIVSKRTLGFRLLEEMRLAK